jgi:hypothetical protein
MWLFLVFLLFILLIQKPGYEASPIFLSRKETQDFLDYDPDGFIRSLTKYDLIARHTNDYFGKISRSALEFTPAEKNDIINKTSKIKDFKKRIYFVSGPDPMVENLTRFVVKLNVDGFTLQDNVLVDKNDGTIVRFANYMEQ